jgi:hypothetical protein
MFWWTGLWLVSTPLASSSATATRDEERKLSPTFEFWKAGLRGMDPKGPRMTKLILAVEAIINEDL